MARIPLVDKGQAPLSVRSFFKNGDPGPITSSLAHVPELLTAAAPFISAIYGPSAMEPREKEIVVLRVSALARCRYCTETHAAVALGAGLSADEVRALRGDQPLDGLFTAPREAALVAWSDLMADAAAPVSDEAVAALREHFSEAEVVELTMVAGATLMLNRYCTALELPTSRGTLAKLEAEGLR